MKTGHLRGPLAHHQMELSDLSGVQPLLGRADNSAADAVAVPVPR